MFSVQARQHDSNPKNRGLLLDRNAEGLSLYPACGDEFRLLKVRQTASPRADFFQDFVCEDSGDGRGPRLSFWNEKSLGPVPTLAQIETVAREQQPARKLQHEVRTTIRVEDFMKAYLESKLGNPSPMDALMEQYRLMKTLEETPCE